MHVDRVRDVPLALRLHIGVAWVLFAIWPFTRLVHAFSMPIGYLTRPYVVYRSRPTDQFGNRHYRRGWSREDVADVSRTVGTKR